MRQLLILSLIALTGCAGGGSYQSPYYSESTLIRNTQGQTIARVQDGNVYNTQGQRIARISKK
jgi:hypothetical protein